MLQRLTVENYALIDHLEFELDEHLTILTGETGAGKSILIGALGLLLGNKNDGTATKDQSRSCIIEGQFDIRGLGLKPLFEEWELDYEEELTLRRVISPSGKSRSFVGDLPAPLQVVKELGARLLDIHSQHQNLVLQSESFRMEALDTVANNRALREKYLEAYRQVATCREALATLREECERIRRDEEWLRHQCEELTQAKLRSGEVEELEQEQQLLAHADRISEVLGTAHQTLDSEEVGLLPQLKGMKLALNHIRDLYPIAEEWSERVNSALLELKDLDNSISTAFERIESNPEKLQQIDDRLALLYALEQKHRVQSLEELIAVRDNLLGKLSTIEHSDQALREAEQRLQESLQQANTLAEELHRAREQAIPAFEQAILEVVTRLGMADTRFEVRLTPTEQLTPMGRERVEYLFSANRTTTLQPIERIASGGELSRVMLALKSLLARHMQLPTLLFDEIDTGVSGRIAEAMGQIINDLSQGIQVVDITHLPQVASKGSAHWVVYKSEGRTHLKRLTPEERVTEIAKMLSGSEITPAALEQARNLLQ